MYAYGMYILYIHVWFLLSNINKCKTVGIILFVVGWKVPIPSQNFSQNVFFRHLVIKINYNCTAPMYKKRSLVNTLSLV